MTVPGEPFDECLAELHAAALVQVDAPLRFFDAHTHLGQNDPDGFKAAPQEIVAGLDRAGQERALIFPMQEPGGYGGPNTCAIAAAQASGGRLEALARIDPNLGNAALAEADRCLRAGARGFKLHPRSDAFDMPHPVVDQVVEIAHEAGAVVLFHAGRGFPGLGEEVAHLSRRFPRAALILAHAGISDLWHLADVVADSPSVYFDTSWWLAGDMLTLFATVPPGRILYASDMPYNSGRFSALRDIRCALQLGLGAEELQSIAGEQLGRLLGGEESADLGPAPGLARLGERDLVLERGIAYLAVACTAMFRGFDPTEPLSLARLALRDHTREVVAQADHLAEVALELVAAHPDEPLAAAQAAMGAQILLGTPTAW